MKTITDIIIRIFPFAAKYLTDIKARTELLLSVGLIINVGFAVYNLCTGLLYGSVWFGGVAIYYTMLCLIKFFLLIRGFDIRKKEIQKYSDLLICGIMLLVMNLTVTALIYQMIWQNRSHFYGNSVILVATIYTIIRLFAATYDSISLKKHNSPTLFVAKALSLSVALMSVFTLQSSLLDRIGIDSVTRRGLNIFTGTAVGTWGIIIAIRIILWANRKLK